MKRIKCKHTSFIKLEKLAFLAEYGGYTKRFMHKIGRACHGSSVKEVAEEFDLDWKAVKKLDIEYMKLQLELAPPISYRALGIDEIMIFDGEYRIIVSDLDNGRVIWYGGRDRKESSLDLFFYSLTPENKAKIDYVVMDMWVAFKNSVNKNAPKAKIIYDKFHIIMHLQKALDQVRRDEYKKLEKKDQKFIKGKRYILLSKYENLDATGKESLKLLFNKNKRLNKAYILKESFGELWRYRRENTALKFFNNWKDSLKYQKLEPYQKFAKLVESHWDGIISFIEMKDKVKLGFVEGMNNRIRVIHRKAYGYGDEEYFKLKIFTDSLPKLRI
jgi:transposase